MVTTSGATGGRTLILAPIGRDSALAASTLGGAGLPAQVCADMNQVCREIAIGAGALLLTQEALPPPSIEQLLAALDAQPPWSDLPVVVLVSAEASLVVGGLVARGDPRVNATLLERPVRAVTLISAIRGALRARGRQYELADLLERREAAEDAERRARTSAEEAVRTRDELLASVAHDLKNPLGAIKGYAQLLRRQAHRAGTQETEKLAYGLDRIDLMASGMVAQIDELLDLARLQAGQPLALDLRPADLVELIRRTVLQYAPADDPERIHLDLGVSELPGVWDEVRLQRVFGNLLSNALKYSSGEGEVTVRVDRLDEEGEAWARVTVRDRGIGIPAADLPRIFQRFYRASNALGRAPGSGLGLAGARQIVEQHGGAISLASEEGRGSTFTVRLPAYEIGGWPGVESETST